MPNLPLLEEIPNYLAAAAGVGIILFTFIYAWSANWRKTEAGRSVMYLVTALDALLGLVTLHLFVKDEYFGRQELRIAVYAWLFYASWKLAFTLIRAVRGGDSSFLSVSRIWRSSRRVARDDKIKRTPKESQ